MSIAYATNNKDYPNISTLPWLGALWGAGLVAKQCWWTLRRVTLTNGSDVTSPLQGADAVLLKTFQSLLCNMLPLSNILLMSTQLLWNIGMLLSTVYIC